MRFTLVISGLISAYAPAAIAGGKPAGEGYPEEHGSGGLPQFDPSSFASQAFWLVVFFTILYVFFSKKTLPDISSVLANRQEHIKSDLESAETVRAEAEEVHQAYEEALSEARKKASEQFHKAEEKIKAKTASEIEAFQARSAQDIQDTEERIAKATEEAMEELNTIAAEVASEAAEKIVGISTDVKQAQTVVESLNKRKAA